MSGKISRNDPCPCGSGKKYKKCCGAGDAISITDVLEQEMEGLQKQILEYAVYHYEDEIENNFEEFQEDFLLKSDEEVEFFEFVHRIWFIAFGMPENGESILQKFIASEAGKIKRPKLKQILQSWKKPRVIAGRIISSEGRNFLVEDCLTLETLEAIDITKIEAEYEEGSFFVGILLPYDQKYVFFSIPIVINDVIPENGAMFIQETASNTGYDSVQQFHTDFFMELMYDLPSMAVKVDIGEMEWPNHAYQEVARIFKEKLEGLGEPFEIIDTGVILWFQYSQKKQKRIQNPNLYAGALHYFISTFVPMESTFSQKELAEKYGVSSGSLSSIYRELENVLSNEVTTILATVNGDTQFGREVDGPQGEVKELLAKKSKKVSQKNKLQAQELLFQAFEAEGNRRYQLAKNALDLEPNHPDGYNILAESAGSMEEAALLYEKGMWVGQKELGAEFFKENKGHFWGLFETRPFMRAKYNYAQSLEYLGKVTEAMQQYEELLELNPFDNQGVRFSLFIVYVEKNDLEKARQLLERYEEEKETAQSLYNQLLLELLEHGFTATASGVLKEAKKANKHVIPYLTGRKQLPEQTPDFYGFGDENEAIIYADAHLQLWMEIEGIQDWLKKG